MVKNKPKKQLNKDSDMMSLSYDDTFNNDLSLISHKSGNTSISLHNVDSIKSNTRTVSGANGKFKVKTLTIMQDGKRTNIKLFLK